MIKVTVTLVHVCAYQIMDIKWTAHLMDVSVHINNRKMLIKLKKLKLDIFQVSAFKWSTFALADFCWLFDHRSYFQLRKKYLTFRQS